MNSLSSEAILSLLYEAYASPLGVTVLTDNPQLLRQRFYSARKKDPSLEKLSIHISPANPAGEIWIVNNGGNSGD